MCLAIPAQIVSQPDEHFAVVEVSGVRRKANIGLLRDEGLNPGDWVLIHVGFAMSKISSEEARKQIELLELLGSAQEARQEVEGYGVGDSPTDLESRETE